MICHGRRVSSPRFVGRSAELIGLSDILDEAVAGRPRLALVVGDAGIGKSRLIAEVAGGSSLRVLTGQCLAVPGGGLPYAPLTGALRQLARETDPETLERLLGAARGELARLLPELSGGARASCRPTGRPTRRACSSSCSASSGDSPPMGRRWSVEDLHWLDDATRALLTFLARNLSNERLLLLATCRADATDAPDGPARLARRARSLADRGPDRPRP
jgi:hypothetical protein